MDAFVETLKAVADPIRLRVLHLLTREGELCVCQMTTTLSVSYTLLSRHLATLRQAGLVEDDKRGRWVYYRIAEKSWNLFAGPTLAWLAEQLRIDEPQLASDAERARRIRCVDIERVAREGARVLDGPRRGTTRERKAGAGRGRSLRKSGA